MSGVILLALLGTGGAVPAQLPPEVRARSSVKLYPPRVTEERAGARPDMVLRWNAAVLEAIRADGTAPPVAARNLAMVHVAVYEAINAIDRTHEVYRFEALAAKDASPEAAAAGAAYYVLVALYPRQRRFFDRILHKSLAALPPGPARDDGLDLGRFMAEKVVRWRASDGADRAGGRYAPQPLPGVWRPTPIGFRPPLLPEWGMVAPFAIRKGTQLRPLGPPPLTSAAYTAAYREVKLLGGRHSKTRTADQTEIAHFWADGAGTVTPPGHWNQIAQEVARQRGNTLVENARMFALLNISLADAGILCWVIKFTHGFWRPVTGIARADEDGNPDTDPDPDWLPLLETPPFPSYTSGHSTFSGAGAAVLAHCFGADRIHFEATSEGSPGVRRSFRSFWAAAEEAGQSRIYGGIHWQFDNMDGLAMGRHLGEYVCRNFLQPRARAVGVPREALYPPR